MLDPLHSKSERTPRSHMQNGGYQRRSPAATPKELLEDRKEGVSGLGDAGEHENCLGRD